MDGQACITKVQILKGLSTKADVILFYRYINISANSGKIYNYCF